MVKKKNDK
jgi:hypothetical protein